MRFIRRATAAGAGLLLSAAALAGAGPVLAANGVPAHYSAPYLQIQASDAGDMSQDMSASGDKYYTLAFLIPSSSSSCTPIWEDNNDSLGAFTSQVSSLQSAGGQVIISSGGASGGELAETCTSTSTVESEYAKYLSTYNTNRLDFDIEGTDLDNTTANARRDSALAALQASNPSVQVDFTLPVDPTGLPSDAMALLQDAQSKGVRVSVVNIMTMDYYDGQPVLSDAEASAKATASQLASLYGISTSQAYRMMGLTPIAGTNDDGAVFSQSNAQSLEQFAASNGVQELAFWEVDGYDKPVGYAYSKIFNQITGGTNTVTVTSPGNQSSTVGTAVSLQIHASDSASGQTLSYSASGLPAGLSINSSSGLISGTPTTAATSSVKVTAKDSTGASGSASFSWTVSGSGGGGSSSTIVNQNSGTCMDVTGGSVGANVIINTCNGSASQNWSVNSNGTITNVSSGLCLDVIGQGTANRTLIDAYTCNGQQNQQWTVNSNGTIVGAQSGSCLSLYGANTANGTDVEIYTCNGSVSENWTVKSSSGGGGGIVNGGFESGSLSGWSTSGSGGAEKVVSSGCHSGSFCAMLGLNSPTNGDSNISQTFTAPSGSSKASFYYDVTCPDDVTYDWATASLKDNTSGTTTTVLAHTCVNPTSGWTQVSAAITGGHSYTLTLTNHDEDNPGDPTYTLYDDVTTS